jgi:hypothetical protein
VSICLFSNFFIQNGIFHEKTEQWPTFPHSHTEGSGICCNVLSMNVCLQHRNLVLVNETTVRQLLALCVSLESMTTKIIPQRAEKVKGTWCQIRAVQWMFKTLPSTAICWAVRGHVCSNIRIHTEVNVVNDYFSCLVFRSSRFEQCLETSCTCRFSLFSSLAAKCRDSTSNKATLPFDARGCGTSWVRFPMASLEFFTDIIVSVALWPWGRLSL